MTVADSEHLLRKVTVPVGQTKGWNRVNGRWVVPAQAWNDDTDEPSVYRRAMTDLDQLYSNCGTSPAPSDNGCFFLCAEHICAIKTVLQRDGQGKEIEAKPYTIRVRPSPSPCMSAAHAVVVTDPGIAAANGRRKVRQKLLTELAFITEACLNSEIGDPARPPDETGAWVRLPPGLAALT